MIVKRTLTALCLTAVTATQALALPPLREVKEIDNNMLWVGIAYEIGKKCPSIEARTVKGLGYLMTLRGQARDLGYSYAEIKDYVQSDAEKARIRRLGEDYARSQGLDPAKTEDLCKLGRDEIARGSQIGVLLKEK